MTPTRHTIADLLAFIDDLPATRGVARRTADAYRTAIRVLQHALDLAPDTDVVDLDVEEALSRLRAQTAGRYTHHSIETYCGNIHRIISLFMGRLPEWKVQPRQGRRGVVTPATTIAYKIQLRPGHLVHIHLPADLTTAEAQRLATFIMSLPADAPDGRADQ